MTASVTFERQVCSNGKVVAFATLAAPRSLNALAMPMVQALQAQLSQWETDPAVAIVVLQGEGDRAFCAGGDIQALYRGLVDQPTDEQGLRVVPDGVRAFFEEEYRLDHALHHFAKPLLCWAHGVVMGGGLGLMMGASHRVVTEQTRMAMPEVSIGLFPDVGGSWFLNRVPRGAGLFLALTGAPLRAADALFAGWADHHLPAASKADLVAALVSQSWGDTRLVNDALLTQILVSLQTPADPATGPLQRHLDAIARVCAAPTLEQVVQGVHAGASTDPWWQAAANTLSAGAPGTVRLAYELLARARGMSLADVFRLEYEVCARCVAQPDIVEGVRALLIDKDRNPAWRPASLAEADPVWAERFFAGLDLHDPHHKLASLRD